MTTPFRKLQPSGVSDSVLRSNNAEKGDTKKSVNTSPVPNIFVSIDQSQTAGFTAFIYQLTTIHKTMHVYNFGNVRGQLEANVWTSYESMDSRL